MNNNTQQFFMPQNAEMLFTITYKFIMDKYSYEIGDRGENDLLVEVMTHISTVYPNASLFDLNKYTLDTMKDIISKKINEIMAPVQQRPVDTPVQQRPEQSSMAGNTDISASMQYEEQQRADVHVPPDRIDFSSPLKTEDDMDVNDAFTKLLTEREIITVPEADLTVTSGHETLQEEPEQLKKFKQDREANITRDHYVVIDSRDRNHDSYANPNSYKVTLEQPLYNVLSMELVSAEIPASQYLINSTNNAIYFQETNAQVSAEEYTTALIPSGNYTLSELKSAIETAMGTASGTGANFTVDIATLVAQNKLSIASDIGGGADLFNLLFSGGTENYEESTRTIYKENSIGPVLGFNRSDLSGSSSYTADFQYNLNGDKYILLKFDDIKGIEGIANNVQDAFTKITMDTHTDNVKYFKSNHDYRVYKFMEKPLTRLDHFHVSFLTYNHSLYDFNGLEHSFTLKVSTLDHKF